MMMIVVVVVVVLGLALSSVYVVLLSCHPKDHISEQHLPHLFFSCPFFPETTRLAHASG